MGISGKLNCAQKTVGAAIVLSSLFLLPLFSFAQGGIGPDCEDQDVVGTYCPLDTWVVILALVTVVFTAIYLQRKQKTLKLTAKGF